MANDSFERQVLFGVLALQNDFISEADLLTTMRRWLQDPSLPLAQLLVNQQTLTADNRDFLVQLVQRHIQQHGGDPRDSLATLSSVEQIVSELRKLKVPLLDETLDLISRSVKDSPPAGHSPTEPHLSRHLHDAETLDRVSGKSSTGRSTLDRRIGREAHETDARFRIIAPNFNGGGLGIVSVAVDKEIDRRVVIKQIREEYQDDDHHRSQLLLEAEITGGLEHPGIIPVYGLGQDDQGRPFYAMKLIRGDWPSDDDSEASDAPSRKRDASLMSEIRRIHQELKRTGDADRWCFQLRKVARRFIDVCEAVHYAHVRGVLHRDLKPHNILLGRYGETLVVDWGLARPVAKQTKQTRFPIAEDEPPLSPRSASGTAPEPRGSAIGTPEYMPPEQAEGRLNELTNQSDVYSLGATLYCLLSGQAPFQRSQELSKKERKTRVLEQVKHGDFPGPRTVNPATPRPLEAICLRAMARDPRQRYESAQALAEDVELWIGGEPVTAWQEPWSIRARRWIRKHQSLSAMVAASVVVGLLIATIASLLLNAAWRDAEASYQTAKDTVDKYFTRVSENTLLNQPGAGMLRLRTTLLSDAEHFYQDRLQKLRTNDAALSEEGLLIKFRVARIGELSGGNELPKDHWNGVVQLYEEVSQRQAELAAQPNASPPQLAAYASTLNAIGRVCDLHEQRQQAYLAYDKARAVRERVCKIDPENREYHRLLANTLMNLGQLKLRAEMDRHDTARQTDNPQAALDVNAIEEAAVLLEQAQAIRIEALSRDETSQDDEAEGRKPNGEETHDTTFALRLDQAKGFYNLGLLNLAVAERAAEWPTTTHRAPADELFRQSGALADELRQTADSTRRPDAQRLLASASLMLAKSLISLHGEQRVPEARQFLEVAIQNLQQLLCAFPDSEQPRVDMATASELLGNLHDPSLETSARRACFRNASTYLSMVGGLDDRRDAVEQELNRLNDKLKQDWQLEMLAVDQERQTLLKIADQNPSPELDWVIARKTSYQSAAYNNARNEGLEIPANQPGGGYLDALQRYRDVILGEGDAAVWRLAERDFVRLQAVAHREESIRADVQTLVTELLASEKIEPATRKQLEGSP